MPAVSGPIKSQDSVPDRITAYLQLRANACMNYHANRNFVEDLTKYSTILNSRKVYEVWRSAAAGNASDCLELGLRMWSGCGAVQNQEGAVEWWRKIVEPVQGERLASASRPTYTKALSCMANAYFERSDVSKFTLQIDDLYRAGKFAAACAFNGFVSPVVLVIANKIETLGLRRQADCKLPGVETARFEALKPLWEALDRRRVELNKKGEKRDAIVSKDPSVYECAAQGCGIESTKRSGLFRCMGDCSPDRKPSYCSKECQKADWKVHKRFCRPDAGSPTRAKPSDVAPGANDRNRSLGESIRDDGKELRIGMPHPIPGRTMQLASKTRTPAFMKEVRDHLEKLAIQK